jgi:hypothetical protein
MATNPFEDLAKALAKYDSGITSALEILIATLVKRDRISRDDVQEWIESLRNYSIDSIKDPESDGAVAAQIARRLERNFFGDEASPQTRIFH